MSSTYQNRPSCILAIVEFLASKSKASRARNQLERGAVGNAKQLELNQINLLIPFQQNKLSLTSYNQVTDNIYAKSVILFAELEKLAPHNTVYNAEDTLLSAKLPIFADGFWQAFKVLNPGCLLFESKTFVGSSLDKEFQSTIVKTLLCIK
jgi:hypothetical protein